MRGGKGGGEEGTKGEGRGGERGREGEGRGGEGGGLPYHCPTELTSSRSPHAL